MKKILIGHDGSKYSHKALKKAVELAVELGSTIIVLSVIPDLHLTELSLPVQFRENLVHRHSAAVLTPCSSRPSTKTPLRPLCHPGNVFFSAAFCVDMVFISPYNFFR